MIKENKKEKFKKRDEILSGTDDEKEQFKNTCYEVMLHKLCNEKCLFCSQDHKSRTHAEKPNDKQIYERILFGLKKGYGMLGFTGGEPLIHPNIIKYIKFAKKAGFKYIRVQTNGVMLGVPGFAEKCVNAGVTLFKFSIHHYKPEIHDYLVGFPGALEKVNYGIKQLKKLGARIGINIVLTKQNYKDIPEFLLYYIDMGVTDFVIILPLYENSMKNEVKEIGFKFTQACEYIIKSLHIFDKLGLKRPLVLNMPLCLLPGYENSIIQTFNGTVVLNLDGSKSNIDDNKCEGKKRVKICDKCEHNQICFGVDEEYIKFWGEEEFLERKEKIDYDFDLDNLSMKKYFTDDELCLIEILNIKSPLSIKDISEIKRNLQICQHCDNMEKLEEVSNSLIKKGYLEVKGEGLERIFSKVIYKK